MIDLDATAFQLTFINSCQTQSVHRGSSNDVLFIHKNSDERVLVELKGSGCVLLKLILCRQARISGIYFRPVFPPGRSVTARLLPSVTETDEDRDGGSRCRLHLAALSPPSLFLLPGSVQG